MPKLPTGRAVEVSAALTCAGVRSGRAASSRALTAAACGAAAEVPVNRLPVPKNVVMPRLVAVRSGLAIVLGAGRAAAGDAVSVTGAKTVVTGPRLENPSIRVESL